MNRSVWLILGVVLIAAGLATFFLEGISYVTEETVLDAGPLEVTAEDEEEVGLPLWVSLVLAGGGVAALLMGFTRSSGSQ
ncbi:MAG: DUF3185 domain-containing protein [Gemmatimonadales bacterium]|nr:MAG: DUF3185 domain-containing protein [Gemmatimonadales bacterium]